MWQILTAVDPSTTVDLAPALQQIGIGILIAFPAWVISWQLWKRLDSAQTRERDLYDRLGPLLASSVDILAKAPERFDRALSQATSSTRSTEVDALMRQLESTVKHIKDANG